MNKKSSKPILLVLLSITFIDWMTIGLVYPIFPYMLFQQDTSFLPPATSDTIRGIWLGILLASASFAQFFSAPILGTISDQKGRKSCLIITVFITCLGYLIAVLSIWWRNLPLLLLGRVIEGIGAGNASVVNASIADISTTEEKTKNFGLVAMAKGFGFTIGPSLGGLLSAWGGFDKPFLIAGLITFVNLIILFIFLRETHSHKKDIRSTLCNFAINSLTLVNRKIAQSRENLGYLFLCSFIFFAGFSFYWEFIPITWIERYKLDSGQVGIFYTLGAGVYALSAGVFIRPIVDRFRSLPILFFSLLLLAGVIFLLLLPLSVGWYWCFIPIQEYLIALIFPTILAFASNAVSEDSQGEVMGILQSLESLAVSIGPLIAGFFIGLYYNMPIIMGAASIFLAWLVLVFGYGRKIFKEIKI